MPSSLFGPETNPIMGVTPRMQMPNNLANIRNMMNMVQSSSNPQAMLNNLVSQNPQMQNVMNLVNQYGGDPRSAFFNLAKAKGIDPNQIINMLR